MSIPPRSSSSVPGEPVKIHMMQGVLYSIRDQHADGRHSAGVAEAALPVGRGRSCVERLAEIVPAFSDGFSTPPLEDLLSGGTYATGRRQGGVELPATLARRRIRHRVGRRGIEGRPRLGRHQWVVARTPADSLSSAASPSATSGDATSISPSRRWPLPSSSGVSPNGGLGSGFRESLPLQLS